MKKNLRRIIIATLIILPIFFVLTRFMSIQAIGNAESVKYYIYASKLDLEAVNSYPQKITRTISDKSPYQLEVLILMDDTRIKSVLLDEYDYPEEIQKYLEPTKKIQSDSDEITKLSKEIMGKEKDITKIASKAAAWTYDNIKYDKDLAQEISHGRVDSRDALETLRLKKGTCSEYTNVFIAVMRNLGVPTRFVTGYVYKGSYHAWAEFYLKDIGWIPVDPQMGKVGVTGRHIKLMTGVDFPDLNVKLMQINANVRIIN